MLTNLSSFRTGRATPLLALSVLILGLVAVSTVPALAGQPAPDPAPTVSPAATDSANSTNLLPDAALDIASSDGQTPLGWHRTLASANQGPVWDRSVGHANGASLSIFDYLPDQPACWPIPNSPNPCQMWYSDQVPVNPDVPYRLHFWALAQQPARAIVGLMINTATGSNTVSVDFEDASDSPTWGERELVLTPDVLQGYGAVQSAYVFVRGAAVDSAVHQVWVDGVEFGPVAASSSVGPDDVTQ
ncbi:MAG TPA: hypothetical protein VKV73_21045 [Chloroflexota bacterium]|nr:hypothetical protein [Chloroflexota bacterium]